MWKVAPSLGFTVSAASALALSSASPAGLGCGSSAPLYHDAGLPPEIENPPLACTRGGGSCSCTPSDAGVVDPDAAQCSNAIAPDASCCTAVDYPFVGVCTCSARACDDGGIRVPSCSSPPLEVDAGCDPSTCGGMSCGGGECCVSACVGGACMSFCS